MFQISEKQLNMLRVKFENLQYAYDTLNLSYKQVNY